MGKPGQKLAKAHRSISLRIPGPARRSSGNRPTIAIAHQQKRNDRPMTGHLLEDLNPGQAKAVAHLAGPAVILAGPGAGQTKIGRASCRERGCQHVSIYVVAGAFTKKYDDITGICTKTTKYRKRMNK